MKTVDDVALEANFACVKGAVGVDALAERYTDLRPAGSGRLKGLCPLHDERTPSFVVFSNGGGRYVRWRCFGACSEGGDVVDLNAHLKGLRHNLAWAMEDLARDFGLKLWRPEDLMSEEQLEVSRTRKRVGRAVADALAEHLFERDVIPLIRAVEDEGERADLLDRCLKHAGLARQPGSRR